jgi:autotransporter-associated beta strand protein
MAVRLRSALLTGRAALSGAIFVLALTLAAAPALADGGAGGHDADGGSGGGGGTGFSGNPGGDGFGDAGGGGGGAGGGKGGNGGGLTDGGAGGTAGSPNGGNGLASFSGGGGGGFNGNGAAADPTILPAAPFALVGGNGGTGANFFGNGSGGGGGGAGGYGAVLTGTGPYLVGSSSSITGGNGGAAGIGDNVSGLRGFGGNGGDGGVGVQFTQTGVSLTNAGTIAGGNGGARGLGGAANGNFGAGGAGIVGSGLTIFNSGTITGGLSGDGVTRANAITFTGGTNRLELQAGSIITGNVVAFSGADTFALGGTTNAIFDVSQIGPAAQYRGFGLFEKTGTSTWTLTGTTAAVTPWAINGGTLAVSSDGNLGNVSGGLSINGGTLQFLAAGFTSNRAVALNAGGGIFDTNGNSATLAGTIGGIGGLTKTGAGTLTLAGISTYSGPTTVNAGTLQAGAANAFSSLSASSIATAAILSLNSFNQTIGSLAGAGSVTLGSATLTTNGDNTSTTFSGAMSGTGGLTKTGSGTLTLSGSSSYSGATAVSAGTLAVNGSIASSLLTTVNAGGTLTGIGTVGATQVNAGGIFAPGSATPGSSMTVASLALASGAFYVVQVNPTAASFTNVTGAATLGGATVSAMFANGSYVAKQYTILTAAGGVSGTFGSLVNTNLPSGFKTALSYDANDAFLNLSLVFVPPPGSGLSGNQQAVGNAIINFFNTNGSIPLVFGGLTPNGLTQASGELATGSQQTTFNAMGLFMGVMTDPFMNRSGGANTTPGASGYADETSAYAANKKTDAFATFTKAPPAPFEQRWSVWTAGFGGSQTTDGNAAVGSNNTTSSVYGTAIGADYLFSPNTIAGFALAGGGTNFSVNGSGSGHSDLFQAGAYILHTEGAAYVSAALAYGWQDITTNRTVSIAGSDMLRAEFNANAYSGRVEGGYRFVAPWTGGIGITPYAAAQFTTFDLPSYAESALSGSSAFALAYGAKDVTDTRSELGIRTDKSFLVPDGILTLRTRFAWAHDYDPNRSIASTFQSLPGASFVVNGAAQAADSALTTASLEMKWRNGWSAAATFEGEFSDVTRSYAGKGVVRYAW